MSPNGGSSVNYTYKPVMVPVKYEKIFEIATGGPAQNASSDFQLRAFKM